MLVKRRASQLWCTGEPVGWIVCALRGALCEFLTRRGKKLRLCRLRRRRALCFRKHERRVRPRGFGMGRPLVVRVIPKEEICIGRIQRGS